MHNIIVVGGGIMGMMCARALSQNGHTVLLLEQNAELGQESSWAGGGICMPLEPWDYPKEVLKLIKRGIALYPELAEELLVETGVDIEWRQTGLLLYCPSSHYPSALQWAEQNQFPLQILSSEKISLLSANLASQNKKGLWFPTIYQLRNPRLLKALKKSLKQKSQIKCMTDCKVTRFIKNQKNITGVETSQGQFFADTIIITTGAWTEVLLHSMHVALPIYPVRGQILLFQAEVDLLPCIVLDKDYYLIPRADGSILAGGTMEDVGFVNQTTETAYHDIYQAVVKLVPALKQYPVVKHWAGLRPGSPQGVPFIAKIAENVWVNAGHFRNGLVMAPAATEKLLNLLG